MLVADSGPHVVPHIQAALWPAASINTIERAASRFTFVSPSAAARRGPARSRLFSCKWPPGTAESFRKIGKIRGRLAATTRGSPREIAGCGGIECDFGDGDEVKSWLRGIATALY